MVPTAIEDLQRLEHAHAWRVNRLARLLRVHLSSSLDRLESGLSPEQYFVLFRLHEQDGLRQQDLVDEVLDDRANISRQVAALDKAGLVNPRPDVRDGRVKRIHLTAAGKALMERLLPQVVEVRRELFGGLDPQDFEAFERVLDALTARLSS